MISNILGNSYSVNLLYIFLETPNLKQKIAYLKQITNFSNNVLYSGLRNLLFYKILIKKDNSYELNFENDLTIKILDILKEEKKKFKFMKTKTIIQILQILKYLENYECGEIYLFGSYAKGTARLDSDIDIAIYSKKDYDWQLIQMNICLKKIPVELHIFKEKDKTHQLQKYVIEQGIKLV